jgi:hypothetical protein
VKVTKVTRILIELTPKEANTFWTQHRPKPGSIGEKLDDALRPLLLALTDGEKAE